MFFWMHGFRYLDRVQQDCVLRLQPGEELFASQQRDNAVDSNAIRLETADHAPVGYMPRYLASEAISLFNSNSRIPGTGGTRESTASADSTAPALPA